MNKDKLMLSTFKRSDGWPRVRKLHLIQHPECAVCGNRKRLVAHHIKPHHEYPELELEPSNIITLCETGSNCHLLFGHLNDFKSWNIHVVEDAKQWNKRIMFRPLKKRWNKVTGVNK